MAREKYVEIAPMISAQLEDEEIDLELPIVEEKKEEVVILLKKEVIQEAIKYIRYLGAAVIPAEGTAYVSHGFPDIVNKMMASGFDIDVKQVEDLYKEWKAILQVNTKVEEFVVEPIVEPIIDPVVDPGIKPGGEIIMEEIIP